MRVAPRRADAGGRGALDRFARYDIIRGTAKVVAINHGGKAASS